MLSLSESVTSLETLLEQFDSASEKLKSIQSARESAQADLSEVHDNPEIPAADRARKSVNLRSLLDVLSSDVERQQAEVDARRKQVLSVADELFNVAGGETNSRIHSKTQQLLTALKAEYDTSSTPGVEELVKSHRSVRALEEVRGGISIYGGLRDEGEKLTRARKFRLDVLEKLG